MNPLTLPDHSEDNNTTGVVVLERATGVTNTSPNVYARLAESFTKCSEKKRYKGLRPTMATTSTPTFQGPRTSLDPALEDEVRQETKPSTSNELILSDMRSTTPT